MELVHKNDNCFRNCVTTMKTIYHSLFFILYEHLINIQIHAEVFAHVPQNKEGEDRVSSRESSISNLERGQGVFACAVSWLKIMTKTNGR